MSPITPIKRKGSMGPPTTPHTPSTGSTSLSMIVTPRTDRTYSSAGRGRSETPFQVKSEPMDPPSPSPRRSREPSALPRMSPMSRALVPYQSPSKISGGSSRSKALTILRDTSATPSRYRFPSESAPFPSSRSSSRVPSRAPSHAPSSARSQSRFSSLAPSDAGSRIAYRDGTTDFDNRARKRRVRERDRDNSTPAPTPGPSLPSLPAIVIECSGSILDILGGLYVQDIDAEEDLEGKDKVEFKQESLTLVLVHLFDGVALADDIYKELVEEEVVGDQRSISRLIDILRTGLAEILTSALEDFAIEGSKAKSKSVRHATWYAKYRADMPGYNRLLGKLNKTDAVTIVSLLYQRWSSDLVGLQVEIAKKSPNAKKGHCRTITENARRLCDMMVADIWGDK